jgi:adenylosuccinate synthase
MNKFNVSVCGLNYGDEAKARVTHWLSKDFSMIARVSGSENAGHTLYHNGVKIVRNYLPSADFSDHNMLAFLGQGMVINPKNLLNEIRKNMDLFPNLPNQLIVDPNAFLITENHIEEDKQNVEKIGSTGKGVGPAYVSKISRNGTKLYQLINDNDETINALKYLGVQFKYAYEMFDQFDKHKILFELSQSLLLDVNFSMHPWCTSGECGINAIINSGFAKFMPKENYGIMKFGYNTRVGNGPMVSELEDGEAEIIRILGNERGAVTNRPRRIGWVDLVATKYACDIGGITHIVLTKADILEGRNKIKVCVGYENGFKSVNDFITAKPIYQEIDGWNNSKDLSQLKPFINLVEKYTGLPVKFVSNGVNPEDMIEC